MKRICLLIVCISVLLVSCFTSYGYYDDTEDALDETWESTTTYESEEERESYERILDLLETVKNTYPVNPNDFIELYNTCLDYIGVYHYMADEVSSIMSQIEPMCIWYTSDSYANVRSINSKYRKSEIYTSNFTGRKGTGHNLEQLFDLNSFTMFDIKVYEPGYWEDKNYDLIITADSNIAFSDYHYVFAFNYNLGRLFLKRADSATDYSKNNDDIFKVFFLDTNWNAIALGNVLKGLFKLDRMFSY